MIQARGDDPRLPGDNFVLSPPWFAPGADSTDLSIGHVGVSDKVEGNYVA